jgi:hypothetical protein
VMRVGVLRSAMSTAVTSVDARHWRGGGQSPATNRTADSVGL